MRKARLCLHLTLREDFGTLEYFIEHNNGEGRWELWTEGNLTPSSGVSAACVELQELLMHTMGDWLSSTNHTSDVG